MAQDQTTPDWRADVQEAVNILLSEDRPTHEAVVLLRRALGQDVFGDPKRVTFDARDVGFTLAQEPQPVAHVPAIDPGPWR